jgi:hypothetical protein
MSKLETLSRHASMKKRLQELEAENIALRERIEDLRGTIGRTIKIMADAAELRGNLQYWPSDGLASGLTYFTYRALVDWMANPKRKPADIAFTSGPARDAGRAFEEHLRTAAEE